MITVCHCVIFFLFLHNKDEILFKISYIESLFLRLPSRERPGIT